MGRKRMLTALGVACAISCLLPAHGSASSTQESIIQDDNKLAYSTPADLAGTLDRIAALGVDRVRVTVLWALVAPNPGSRHRPRFDATDPDAYPAHAWDRYDTLVRLAAERGLGVYFTVTEPGPDWATTSNPPTGPKTGWHATWSPSVSEFGQFIEALGTRYSGSYVPPAPGAAPAAPPPSILGAALSILRPPTPPEQPPPPGPPLPRVNYWSIWNEPGQGGWLTPQWTQLPDGRWIPAAPAMYRRLLDAAWAGLAATGHGADTILIGETASSGRPGHGLGTSMAPAPFIDALYCVSRRLRPLTGAYAIQLGCPARGKPSRFATAHPALFQATGYAHHPYSFHRPPAVSARDTDEIPLANLGRLERALDKIFVVYGQRRRIPIYLTEYGYKSNPPNPFVEFTPAQQAAFINQGEYMAYRDPRVRALGQYLLVDDRPKSNEVPGTRAYWGTFQTGLLDFDQNPKPAYGAYRIPIWLPSAHHGARVTIWCQLRPAPHGSIKTATVTYRRKGTSRFRRIASIQTDNARGFMVNHVAIPAPGWVRVEWYDAAATAVYRSRTVWVS